MKVIPEGTKVKILGFGKDDGIYKQKAMKFLIGAIATTSKSTHYKGKGFYDGLLYLTPPLQDAESIYNYSVRISVVKPTEDI